MKKIYQEIWDLAKPYYKKGRPMDLGHIEWMMRRVEEICNIEKDLDESILMPLAILHDVGYSEIKDPINSNYYDIDIRKAHMQSGATIAGKILNKVSYPIDKKEKIINYVSIHDNWAYGKVEIYIKDKLLGTFKDLDYLWIYTKEGCESIQKTLKKQIQKCSIISRMNEYPSTIKNLFPPNTQKA